MPEGLLDTPKHRGREQQKRSPGDEIPCLLQWLKDPTANAPIYTQEPSDPGICGPRRWAEKANYTQAKKEIKTCSKWLR